jgi:hypothetical protein
MEAFAQADQFDPQPWHAMVHAGFAFGLKRLTLRDRDHALISGNRIAKRGFDGLFRISLNGGRAL